MMIQKDFRHNQENLAPFLRFCVGICFLFSALWKVFHMNEGFRYVIFIFFSLRIIDNFLKHLPGRCFVSGLNDVDCSC